MQYTYLHLQRSHVFTLFMYKKQINNKKKKYFRLNKQTNDTKYPNDGLFGLYSFSYELLFTSLMW